jgi:hypothetical protein
MADLHFSPATGLFYDEYSRKPLPADAIPVSAAQADDITFAAQFAAMAAAEASEPASEAPLVVGWSPSTGGFYPSHVSYPSLPGDLIEITPAEHAMLIAGQAAGQVIVSGRKGVPELADPPRPTAEEARAMLPPLTRAQLMVLLIAEGFLPEADVVAWAEAGTLPPAIAAAVEVSDRTTMEKAAARVILATFQRVFRTDSLVEMLRKIAPVAVIDADLDALWMAYASSAPRVGAERESRA